MILKGQVNIQRWGREGDTNPIEEIKALCKRNATNKLSDDDMLLAEKAEKYWKKLQEGEFVDEGHKLPAYNHPSAGNADCRPLRYETKVKSNVEAVRAIVGNQESSARKMVTLGNS